MTIKEAIEKAVAGGWRKGEKPDVNENKEGCWVQFFGGHDTGVIHQSEIFLDKDFWQALGKSLGWGTEMFDEDDGKTRWHYFSHCPVDGEILMGMEQECPNACDTENPGVISWLYDWHNFIDHLASGKSVESFFEELT